MSVLIPTAMVATPSAAARSELTVFAAASLAGAMDEVVAAWSDSGGVPARVSYAASSTLAKQIERGAPADVYLSANPKWMDYLEERGLIDVGSRTDLLGNRLALVVAGDDPRVVEPTADLNLSALLGDGRLAVGDPDHVPAGDYARQALQTLGLWEEAKDRLARTSDVRAALALVARGEAAAGIVYETDAAVSDGVRVAGLVPQDSHSPIVYPAAVVKGAGEDARRFLEYLRSPPASDAFQRYGFSVH